jgi:hypothetical protein
MPSQESRIEQGDNGLTIKSKPDISIYGECLARACTYLSVTQQRLRDGYRWDKSGKRAFCVGIAREVAEILLPVKPSIIEVLGERVDGLHNEPLIPKCYEGTDNGFGQRVIWTDHHLVCAIDDVIFDPIVGKPIDAHLYRTTIFESPVLLNTHVPANEIATYLKNPLALA